MKRKHFMVNRRRRAGWPVAALVSVGLLGAFTVGDLTMPGAGVAQAAKRKPKPKKKKLITKASEQTQKGIASLLGKLKFGNSLDDVKKVVLAPISVEFGKKIEAAK